MTTQPQPSGIVPALARIASQLAKVGISKDRKNQQQGFSFRGVDDVYGALSPLLAAEGIIIAPHVEAREVSERQTKSGGALYVTVATVRYVLHHPDGSTLDVVVCGEGSDSGDKSTSKALSMAFKYMAFQVFCIPVQGMDDADETTPEPTVPKAKKDDKRPDAFDLPDQALAAIKQAKTMQGLKEVFARAVGSGFTGDDKAAIVAAKDAKKAELEAAA